MGVNNSFKAEYLLLCLLLFITNLVHGQQVPIKLPSNQIRQIDVIKTIENQSPFRFSYEKNTVSDNKLLTFERKDYVVRELLQQSFGKQGITWRLIGESIILNKDEEQELQISGRIQDAESGESLHGAHILEVSKDLGTYSNDYGFFSLALTAIPTSVIISHLGYETKVLPLYNRDSIPRIIYLAPSENKLEEVVVKANPKALQKNQISELRLDSEQVKTIPQILGENDVLKGLQLLPGVQSGTEGSSGIYVRGGSPDQNLILLDGVPVYNSNHLFGFFSIFNSDAIKDVTLIKGGFPARYGGRLSSVVDIKMKDGNNNDFEVDGALGVVSSKLTVQGPITKGKSSFLISGRRTYLDLFIRPLANLAESQRITYYHFWDINGKLTFDLSEYDKLFFSTYAGKDNLEDEFKNELNFGNRIEINNENAGVNWGNLTAALRWNHIFGPKLFSNTTLTYSQYRFDLFSSIENLNGPENQALESVFTRNDYFSSVRDWAAKIDFEFNPSVNYKLRFGGSYTNHRFVPGISNFKSNTGTNIELGADPLNMDEFFVYTENHIDISSKISFNIGVHASGAQAENTFYTSIQPRLSGRWQFNTTSTVRVAYSRMNQFINLLANSGVGLPTDLWLPTTDEVRPQVSDQIGLGLTKLFGDDFELSIEAYYKNMQNLIEYKDGAGFVDIDNSWEDKIEIGRGKSYGLEFLLRKNNGNTKGWLGYTWSRSFRTFNNLNFGNTFPFRYDRPNDINIFLQHQLSKKVDLSITWVYGTGYPITLPNARFNTSSGSILEQQPMETVISYPARNAARIKDYHRLDLGVSFSKEKKWGSRKWIFGVYNVYSRLNPTFIEFDDANSQNQKFSQLSLFPIIPSITYQFKIN